MRAAIYARYSSDLQRDASVEDQIRVCRESLERAGHDLQTTFSDRAISGASMLRPGLQGLLQAAHSGGIDLVVAEALDRLSRDQADVATIYKRLKFAGVSIVTLAEGAISELHVGLKGTMNSIFLRDLADKTRRGLRGRVEAGRSGGGVSYGYDTVREFDAEGERVAGKRSINADEAAVIIKIFEAFAAGKSPRRIALNLNQQNVAGPSGAGWTMSTINGNPTRGTGILNNELYIGTMVWNRLRYVKDPDSGKRVSRLNSPDQWVHKDVADLRIVPQELWDRVKARQLSVKRDTRPEVAADKPFWDRRRPRYLFSGLMRCGTCGGSYTKISATLFGCATARNKGTCDNRLNIRADQLDALVLDGLRAHLMDPALFKEFADAFVKETNSLLSNENAKVEAAQSELKRADLRLKKLVDVIVDGVPVRTVKDEMLALEARQDELRALLDAPPPIAPRLHPNLAEVYRQKVANLQDALTGEATRSEAFDIIRSLVEEIRLVPVAGSLRIELAGDLASILGLCSGAKKAASGDAVLLEQVKMVAGRGFEPLTFRL